jgi:hypothetical protein
MNNQEDRMTAAQVKRDRKAATRLRNQARMEAGRMVSLAKLQMPPLLEPLPEKSTRRQKVAHRHHKEERKQAVALRRKKLSKGR